MRSDTVPSTASPAGPVILTSATTPNLSPAISWLGSTDGGPARLCYRPPPDDRLSGRAGAGEGVKSRAAVGGACEDAGMTEIVVRAGTAEDYAALSAVFG